VHKIVATQARVRKSSNERRAKIREPPSAFKNKDLKRLEIRVGCVIGIIAAILTLRLDSELSTFFKEIHAINIIIVYWALYIGFVAIAVSEQPLGLRFSMTSKEISDVCFAFGVMVTGLEAFAQISYLGLTYLSQTYPPVYPEFGPPLMFLLNNVLKTLTESRTIGVFMIVIYVISFATKALRDKAIRKADAVVILLIIVLSLPLLLLP
jgi:hypothetical protein